MLPRIISRVGVVLASLLLAAQFGIWSLAQADTPPVAPQLQISELNITGDEFALVKNVGTAPANLRNYWLGYTSDPTATAVPAQQLADQTLAAGSAVLLTKAAVPLCGAGAIDTLGFSLANSAGKLALWQLDNSGQAATFSFLSSLSWGKAIASPPFTPDLTIASESSVTSYEASQNPPIVGASTVWYLTQLSGEAAASWHVGFLEDCSFTPVISSTQTGEDQPVNWQTSDNGPPFTVEPPVGGGSGGSLPHIPGSDKGLLAVQLSEILPNPASPQTDADNEFIELYNPNGKAFDLSGFILQTASLSSSTTHTYHIPNGTIMAPGSFRAFMASQTHLSLSNSGGQVWLLDPLGATMAESAAYGTAKDGYAWVNAAGKWQWSALATPGSANKLATPLASSGSGKSAVVNGKKVTGLSGSNSAVLGSSTDTADQIASLPIHVWTLVIIAFLALLYGTYEYRHDLKNRLHQYRTVRAARKTAG